MDNNPLTIISDVRCYLDEDGIVQLNIEDVSRGLGFTQTKNDVEYIRWETIYGYLAEFGFSQQVGKEGFIPENIFYKLCFKAKNAAAIRFQDKITDEVIPSIRKHGAYMTDDALKKAIQTPDFLIGLANALKEEQEQRAKAEAQLEANAPLVIFAEAVQASEDSILIGELAKVLKQKGIEIGRKRLFAWLRDNGYLMRVGEERNQPTQYSMNLKLFEIKKGVYTDSSGYSHPTTTTKVTAKGQIYFVNLFLKNAM